MEHDGLWIPLLLALAVSPTIATRSGPATAELPITVRPSMLASTVDELAGRNVRVPYARVVGVFEPRVFLIETASQLPPLRGFRDRVIVLIHPGALRVPPKLLVASTVTVSGVARTILGVQVTREVPWPSELDRELIERLEVRAALLATSVQTADGVELTDQSRPSIRERPRN
jgi:hypothetical protein